MKTNNETSNELLQVIREGLKHDAPTDCWATGPKTGNAIEDYLVCPACRALNAVIELETALQSNAAPTVQPSAELAEIAKRTAHNFNYNNGLYGVVQPLEAFILTALTTATAKLREEVQRLTDLVRYQRAELHEAELITTEEYAALAGIKGSPARLETYDEMRSTITTLTAEVSRLKAERGEVLNKAASEARRIGSKHGLKVHEFIAMEIESAINRLAEREARGAV